MACTRMFIIQNKNRNTKDHNSKTESNRNCSQMVTELWGVQEFFGKKIKGHNLETKYEGTFILAHDTSSLPFL